MTLFLNGTPLMVDSEAGHRVGSRVVLPVLPTS